jgi:hypothetical protein
MRCQITFSATRSPVPHFEHLYFDIGDYFGACPERSRMDWNLVLGACLVLVSWLLFLIGAWG